ncbi:MAG TPA: MaoC family dehydratase [Candidatus Lambdaproteobacteria bacterium]|nr:MaoC family dehydratase [SAR324 cluster bacterium]HBL55298.1 acyl dehydratase [Deltaproteobacteria bacterium]HHZ78079.1 MaoC family dehydratase [Candidatus Lambdaproteobacteria bacterium]HIB45965.1 MaoC family dehydratase [Candidatus Lambdaproteobacteria bacterium]HIB93953.1 MaoC family dehydratase [Candidatus Lambdaproteobacteria bacterium]
MSNTNLPHKREERFFEDYIRGAVFVFGPLDVDEDEVLEFARRYDPQPFHIDHDAAKKGPYEGLIASGWQTCAFVMRALVDNYFSPASSLGSPGIDELRWMIPVRPGDKLTVRATIIDTKRSRSKPDRGIVRTFIETLNQRQEIVMSFRSVNFMLCLNISSTDAKD